MGAQPLLAAGIEGLPGFELPLQTGWPVGWTIAGAVFAALALLAGGAALYFEQRAGQRARQKNQELREQVAALQRELEAAGNHPRGSEARVSAGPPPMASAPPFAPPHAGSPDAERERLREEAGRLRAERDELRRQLDAALSAPPASVGDPLDNHAWLSLVEECVELFDELDRHAPNLGPPQRELADHVALRLREILERSGTESIDGDGGFDRNRHQPEPPGSVAAGAPITETLSPGFAVGRRVLRRARVRVSE